MYNKPADSHQASLFGDLESMLNRKRSLYILANLIDWDVFESGFKKHKPFRKRAGIEPVIGHCKEDHRPGRNFYKGLFGDSINVMLAAAAFNFKRVMNLLLYPFRSLANMASGWDLRLMFVVMLLPLTPRVYIRGWRCAF